MRRRIRSVMRRPMRFRSFQSILSFFIGTALLSSCAQLKAGVSPKDFFAEEKASLSKPFYSEDYIVHKLRSGETPEVLAGLFLGDKGKSWIIEEANRSTLFEEGQFVVIPLKEDKGGLHRDGYQVVPVLCYHRFADICDASLCTPTDLFERQMNYLETNG